MSLKVELLSANGHLGHQAALLVDESSHAVAVFGLGLGTGLGTSCDDVSGMPEALQGDR